MVYLEMAKDAWLWILDLLKTLALPAATVYLAYRFGTIQAATAKQQAATARTKLRLDLFERRMKVYDASKAFIGSVISNGVVDPEARALFAVEIKSSRWLFDEPVHLYLNVTMWDKTLVLDRQNRQLADEGHSAALGHEIATTVGWFFDQFSKVDELMSPYLQLKEPSDS
ncbi:MAG: hypothetical protein KKB95_09350 [Gammaproteobacteria bacterium]|nr:hypothetical protein [Gammaproteobacteria bacterium]MBU1505767.1 hypothetical protein [Gammaproteobacteria bacterium]MBU2119455.1 hypothetical protein [Gammaproteobacteria bacterium]MBU2172639.1 hypothetical protein [Gammaproteobacteria bacterium]MBU2202097.1 hypothetical protein [Gammaproteobacteria bacterium]